MVYQTYKAYIVMMRCVAKITVLEYKRRQIIFKSVLILTCLFLTGLYAFAQETASPLPKPTAPVTDNANVIDAATEQRLNARLKQLQAQQKIEFAVVTVSTTNGQPIFDYSLAVASGWGIGSKEDDNPSLLLLVAIDDKKYFTQVSRDLEGDLPDGVTGEIQREKLVPAFRQRLYSQGINDTIETYISTLEQKRGFKLEGAPAPSRPTPRRSTGTGVSTTKVCCIVIIVIIVIIIMLMNNRGSRGGRRGGGGGGFIPFPIFIGGGGGGSDSSWGSSSGGGSSGGSDWGGFGGGGDFGGGGSGGSW